MAIVTKNSDVFFIELVAWIRSFGEYVCEEMCFWFIPKILFTNCTIMLSFIPNFKIQCFERLFGVGSFVSLDHSDLV